MIHHCVSFILYFDFNVKCLNIQMSRALAEKLTVMEGHNSTSMSALEM